MMARPSPLFAPSPHFAEYRAADLYLPSAAWVGAGEGVAYRWWKGHLCQIFDGDVFKLDVVPQAVLAMLSDDQYRSTGRTSGPLGDALVWIVVDEDDELPFVEAYANRVKSYCERVGIDAPENGIYFLVDEEEGFPHPSLVPMNGTTYLDAPRDFAGLRDFLRENEIHGLVWEAPGRPQVTVFAEDFGPLDDEETSDSASS